MADKKVKKISDEKVMIIIPKPRNVVGDTETIVSVKYRIMSLKSFHKARSLR